MFRREIIDEKIIELRRALATTDDELTVALLIMAIESFESERAVLVQGPTSTMQRWSKLPLISRKARKAP